MEFVVLRHLFECFGNAQAVQNAIEAAQPNRERTEEIRQRLNKLDTERDKNKVGRAKLLTALERELAPEDEVMAKLEQLKQKDDRERDEIAASATASNMHRRQRQLSRRPNRSRPSSKRQTTRRRRSQRSVSGTLSRPGCEPRQPTPTAT